MMFHGVRTATVLILVLAYPSVCILADDGEDAVDVALLAEFSIEPSPSGAIRFLSSIPEDPAATGRGRSLINDLSDESFRIREAATKAILELEVIPTEELERAATSADPEVARRAERILRSPRAVAQAESVRQRPAIVTALCRTIERRHLPGTVPALLELLPELDGDEEGRSARSAIRSTATTTDLVNLRRLLGHDNPRTRAGAVCGIEGVLGQEGVDEIRAAAMNDDSSDVRLVAATSLARLGSREALEPLVRLLDSADESVRAEGLTVLRGLTGIDRGLDPYAAAESRKEAVSKWRQWLAEGAKDARIHHPAGFPPIEPTLARGLLLHFTFDADQNGQVVDSSGGGRHGVAHNACEQVVGVHRNGLAVNGAGHHGSSGGHVTLPFVDLPKFDSFSIAMWVNEHSMSHQEGEAYLSFGVDRGVGIEDAVGISHFNDDLWFRVGQGSVRVPFDASHRGKWVHYALVYAHGRVRAYRDGRVLGDAAGRVAVVGQQAALGRHWWGDGAGTSTRFVGRFDDVRVYNRALEQGELMHLATP